MWKKEFREDASTSTNSSSVARSQTSVETNFRIDSKGETAFRDVRAREKFDELDRRIAAERNVRDEQFWTDRRSVRSASCRSRCKARRTGRTTSRRSLAKEKTKTFDEGFSLSSRSTYKHCKMTFCSPYDRISFRKRLMMISRSALSLIWNWRIVRARSPFWTKNKIEENSFREEKSFDEHKDFSLSFSIRRRVRSDNRLPSARWWSLPAVRREPVVRCSDSNRRRFSTRRENFRNDGEEMSSFYGVARNRFE